MRLPTLFSGRSLEARANPFESPAMPLTSVGLLTMFGGTPTDAGVSVSEENAFSVATYWRCSMLLAGLVAGFPLRTFERVGKAEVFVPALSTPATGTAFEQWETAMLYLLGWGNIYMQKVRNGLGTILDLVPIYPGRVVPVMDRQSRTKVFIVTDVDGHPDPFTSFEIMHIPGPSIDGIRGMGIVEMARQSIGTAMAGDKLAAKQFGNGALMAGMLTADRVIEQEEATSIKKRWREVLAGVDHAHDIVVAGAGTHFEKFSMSNADAQFIQSKSWSALEICRWFGIPPHLAQLVDKSTSWGTGIEQQNIGLLKFTVHPYTTRIEQRVTLEVVGPASQYSQFDTADLLKGDTPTRFAAYQSAITTGWLTRNEARARENLPPIDGLDVPLVPTVAPPAPYPGTVELVDPTLAADAADDTDPVGALT